MKKGLFFLLGALALTFSFTSCEKDEFNCIHNDTDSVVVTIHDTIHVGGGPVVDPCSRPEFTASLFTQETEVDEGENEILAGLSLNVDTCCVDILSMKFTCMFFQGASDDVTDFMQSLSIFADHEELVRIQSVTFQRLSAGMYTVTADLEEFTICNGFTSLQISVIGDDDMDDDGGTYRIIVENIRYREQNGEVRNQPNIVPNSTMVTFAP